MSGSLQNIIKDEAITKMKPAEMLQSHFETLVIKAYNKCNDLTSVKKRLSLYLLIDGING